MTQCSTDGCNSKPRARGLCNAHYLKFIRHNGPMPRKTFCCDYAENASQFSGPFDNCVCIPLTKGHHALIDADDFDIIGGKKWHVREGRGKIYATRSHGEPDMHKVLLKSDMPMVDHINGNTLDNRKANLRACTNSQNQQNSKPQNGKQYKGICQKDGKWRAQIKANGKRRHIGSFNSQEDAAKAYDMHAIKYFGEFAKLNFYQEVYNG